VVQNCPENEKRDVLLHMGETEVTVYCAKDPAVVSSYEGNSVRLHLCPFQDLETFGMACNTVYGMHTVCLTRLLHNSSSRVLSTFFGYVVCITEYSFEIESQLMITTM
jgi:hypothetical protein